MPNVISAISFDTTFQVGATPQGLFGFIDTTDYVSAGIPLSGVRGVFKIVSPGGTDYYNNTNYGAADVVRNISPNNAIPITLPIAGSRVAQGVYTITYSVQINDGSNPVYILTSTVSYNYQYKSPFVCIDQQVDCISPLFTSTDKTNYVVGGVTPTITRTHTVSFPAPVSPVVGSGAKITLGSNQFYLGEQYTVISSILSYAFSNFTVTDSVTGQKAVGVNCEFMCKVSSCLAKFDIRLEQARKSNQLQYQQMSEVAGVVAFKLTDLMIARSCGNQKNVNSLIKEIQQLVNCDDCGCDDGQPKLVVGLGGGSSINVVIQSGNDDIVVTSETVGTTTTWTLTFSQTLVDKINNAYNTVVQTTDGSITWVASGIINGVQTYTGSVNQKYILVYSDTVPSAGSPPSNKTFTLVSAIANTMAVGDKLVLEMVIEPSASNPVIGAGAGLTINAQPNTTT